MNDSKLAFIRIWASACEPDNDNGLVNECGILSSVG